MTNETNPLVGRFAPPPEKQFYSVGCLCQLLQIVPGQLDVMMEHCEVTFAYAVDGVGMVRGDDVVKMAGATRRIRDEIQSATTSHERN